jgi:hypothetical protein
MTKPKEQYSRLLLQSTVDSSRSMFFDDLCAFAHVYRKDLPVSEEASYQSKNMRTTSHVSMIQYVHSSYVCMYGTTGGDFWSVIPNA